MGKRIQPILLLMCCFAAAGAAAGDLWIISPVGSEVFLDGKSVGVAESADAGIRISGLTPGEHTVRISKDEVISGDFGFKLGYAPTQVVVLGPGKGSSAGAEESVGAIEVTSNPKECAIRLGVRKFAKKQPILLLTGIPVGEHELRFEIEGMSLRSTVAVQTGQPAQVKVDFGSNRVAVVAAPSVEDSSDEEQKPAIEAECIEYWIQVLRSDSMEVIEAYQQTLQELGFYRENQKVITVEEPGAAPYYKLRVGPIERSNKAKWAAGQIRNAGIPSVWILPEECDPNAPKNEKEKYRPIR